MGRKLRVALLCDEELVPRDSIEGLTDQEIADWRSEFDVLSAMRDLGHEAEPFGVAEEVDAIRDAVRQFKPDLCFNLMVEFHRVAEYDQHAASYLELLKVPYTGCNPRGLTLARDKALSKKILHHDGVPVPRFLLVPRGKAPRRPADLEFPLFVKSATEEASLGISQASIVRSDRKLAERARFIHEKVGTDAIAEEYIEGREFYAGVLGNERIEVFPPWELCIPNLAPGAPRIATRRLKWDIGYQKRLGVKNRRAEGLGVRCEGEIDRIARTAYRSLGLSGYARLDLRMRDDGSLFVLEANPNPDITFGEDFAEAAEAGGMGYEALIDRILRLGLRYRAGWTL
jgi:D-alanine-D-alanine ligase